MIRMRTPILAPDAGRLAQRLPHGLDIPARHRHMIDVKLLPHKREGDAGHPKEIAHHL
jgi:hypothetical protein